VKLFRWGAPEAELPGVVWQGRHVDASGLGEDFDERFFGSGGLLRLQIWLGANNAGLVDVPESARRGPCVARPSKIVCVGLNYRHHAQESNLPLPAEPVLFFKSTTALCGPRDDLVIPPGSVKTDWEVELAVVIGAKTKNVPEAEAHRFIAGYCVHNDYSEREYQLERGGQWVKGKSCDTFAPLGPYLVTADEIPDPHRLRLWLTLNGQTMQDSSTAEMVFPVPFLVSYISRFMTLLPGDVISTGTPAGVGLGKKPPLYLKRDDIVELGIDGLGTQRQRATTNL
jgi:2-keto-4-pentenoate hydratase/2-oxohepta-3-ene-1,7-dioic acid hydratase in catechol pathway